MARDTADVGQGEIQMKSTGETSHGLIDPFSVGTYQEDADEICCPSCGSWAEVENLEPNEHGIASCTLCNPNHTERVK